MGAQVHAYQYGGTPEGLVDIPEGNWLSSVTGRVTVFRLCETHYSSRQRKSMPEFNTLQYQVVDHVLTLTMNRPERLNALNSEMQREFLEALDHADQDDEIRA